LVLWERKIAYQQALEIKAVAEKTIEVKRGLRKDGVNWETVKEEIGKRVIREGMEESKVLTDAGMAASLGISTDDFFKARGYEGKEMGRKRKGKGMWGYEKKQLPKNSTWFTV
jgi:hypothetical protein